MSILDPGMLSLEAVTKLKHLIEAASTLRTTLADLKTDLMSYIDEAIASMEIPPYSHYLDFGINAGASHTYHAYMNNVNQEIDLSWYIPDSVELTDPAPVMYLIWQPTVNTNGYKFYEYIGTIKTDGSEVISWNIDNGTIRTWGYPVTANALYCRAWTINGLAAAGDMYRWLFRRQQGTVGVYFHTAVVLGEWA